LLTPSPCLQLEKLHKLELPLWLATRLHDNSHVSIQMPEMCAAALPLALGSSAVRRRAPARRLSNACVAAFACIPVPRSSGFWLPTRLISFRRYGDGPRRDMDADASHVNLRDCCDHYFEVGREVALRLDGARPPLKCTVY